jgi:hypothetical protein
MRKAPRALGGANPSTASPPSPARTLALPGGNSSTACSSPASSNSFISANKTTSASDTNYTSNIDSNAASTNSFRIGTAYSTADITSTFFTSKALPPSDWCVLRLTESWKRSMLWTRRHGLCLVPTPRNASLFRVSQRQCHPWGLMILSVLHAHPLAAIKYRWNHIPSPPNTSPSPPTPSPPSQETSLPNNPPRHASRLHLARDPISTLSHHLQLAFLSHIPSQDPSAYPTPPSTAASFPLFKPPPPAS